VDYDRRVPEPADAGAERPRRWDRRRTLAAVVGGAIVAGVLLLLVVGLTNQGVSARIDHALAAGERPAAPAFDLPVLVAGAGVGPIDRKVALASLGGRPIVLNFWASWCGPCAEEAPIMEAVWERYRARGVLMLGLDSQDLRDDALAFVREQEVTYPSVRDGGDRVRDAYGITGLPETFLIDAQGRVALHIPGVVTDPEQLTVPLDDLLAESAPAGGGATG
jgi:cytochrome c biogenesis protein CcmG/thiol:disulfide interchange protein DsbE